MSLPSPRRSHCAIEAWRCWQAFGGYLAIRRSAYGRWWHILWMPADSAPPLAQFIPVDAVEPEEWRAWPWWRRAMVWKIWRGRPRDLLRPSFEGRMTLEVRERLDWTPEDSRILRARAFKGADQMTDIRASIKVYSDYIASLNL